MTAESNPNLWAYDFRVTNADGITESFHRILAERLDDSTQNIELYIGQKQVGSIPKGKVILWSASKNPGAGGGQEPEGESFRDIGT